MSRARELSVLSALCSFLGAWGAFGCSLEDTGVVEVNWAVVDRDGDPIYPAGQFMASGDTCDMPALSAGKRVQYDLEVELEICDPMCKAGCDDPDCLVMPPSRYSCTIARATERDVPASSDPYLFTVRAIIAAPGGDCVDPLPTCIATPGPRQRTVYRGLVTDLQVFQIAVNVDTDQNEALDLEACGCA
jgi:hypothetical protein